MKSFARFSWFVWLLSLSLAATDCDRFDVSSCWTDIESLPQPKISGEYIFCHIHCLLHEYLTSNGKSCSKGSKCPCDPRFGKGKTNTEMMECIEKTEWYKQWDKWTDMFNKGLTCGINVFDSFPEAYSLTIEQNRKTPFKVSSGHNAGRGQFPWALRVAVGRKYSAQALVQGTAVLIAPRWALTSAHVARHQHLQPNRKMTLYGGHYSWKEAMNNLQYTSAIQIIAHPSYDKTLWEGGENEANCTGNCVDLALIKLKEPIHNTVPICLPNAGESVRNRQLRVFGFGAVDLGSVRYQDLQWVDLKVKNCHQGKEFCAEKAAANTCRGDSGGGWTQLTNRVLGDGTKRWVLMGVTARGPTWSCGNEGEGEAVDIRQHVTWICQTIKYCNT